MKVEYMKFLKRNLIAGLVFAMFVLYACEQVKAHFVWVFSEDGKVKVVFGEGLEPGQEQFLSGLSDMKAFAVVGGKFEPVEFGKQVDGDQGWFEASQDKVGQLVEVTCPYGVFGRGEKTMFLDYSAKYVSMPNTTNQLNASKPSKNLALDIVPSFANGNLTLTAYFKGYPLKGVEIQLENVESESLTRTTDETGQVVLNSSTRYTIRAKHTVAEAGEVDGESFSERRFYCTMVLDTNSLDSQQSEPKSAASHPEENSSNVSLKKVEAGFADFPRGMTSFGATVLDNRIYVIGGKSGRAHSYAKSYQNRNVYCLNLDGSDNQWQIAGENLGLQGLAIVGHAGKVYRIGGLEARNKEGEDQDLHSVNDFVAFDPVEKTWTELPALPEGRSSFDACVAGDHVYVVGGWKMAGEKESVWATDMLRFDLSNSSSKWEKIEAPFSTRALCVRAFQDKLVVIGGIQQAGGPTNAVHVYDMKTGKWSEGPVVPTEGGMKAFGCSAVSIGDHLLVSTYDGGIFQFGKDGKSWTKIHQLDAGRFFHQMLPVGENRFALVGGSHMEHGSHLEVEVFELQKSDSETNGNGKISKR